MTLGNCLYNPISAALVANAPCGKAPAFMVVTNDIVQAFGACAEHAPKYAAYPDTYTVTPIEVLPVAPPAPKQRGLRAVVSDLVEHVRHYDVPDGDRQYADFIEQWGERLLRATGYHVVAKQRDDLVNVLGRLAMGEEVAAMDADPVEEVRARIALARDTLEAMGILVEE